MKLVLLVAALAGVALASVFAALKLEGAWRLMSACALIIEMAGILAALEMYVPRARIVTRSFCSGKRGSRLISISFDDGPDPGVTGRILDVLKEHGAGATFFVLGKNVEENEALLRRMLVEGHEIGNHGYSHRKMHLMSRGRIEAEIKRAEALIEKAAGRRPELMRTPHGFVSPLVGLVARKHGYLIVGWSRGVWDTDDGASPGDIAMRALKNISGGDILLLHDARGEDGRGAQEATAEALPRILEGLKERKFDIVPIGVLLKGMV